MEKINYELYLEKYLDGELTSSEKIWLEKEIDGNSYLQRELEFRREVNHLLVDEDLNHFTEQLEGAYQDYQHKPFKRPFLSGTIIKKATAVGSVAASLIIAFTVYINTFKQLDNHELYERFFEPYEATIYRSAGDDINMVFREAMKHYENKNYSQAVIWFEKALAQDSLHVPTNFYSGISYMETEKYSKANHSFEVILDQKNQLFYEHAEWYLGFCYLMTDQSEKAENQFEKIEQSEGYYQDKASKVLNYMR